METSEFEQRRQAAARVAADLIAREGREAATVRRIASELGCSTTMITHYFDDKDEVLSLAYQHIAEEGHTQFLASVDAHNGDLLEVLLSMTIHDDESLRRWRVYMAFWEKAGHDPLFSHVQREWVERTLDNVCTLICRQYGEREDARTLALQLIALVHGIALQTNFNAGDWPPEVVRGVLERQVNVLLN